MSVIDSKIPNGTTPWDGYKGSRVEEYIKERFTKVESGKQDVIPDLAQIRQGANDVAAAQAAAQDAQASAVAANSSAANALSRYDAILEAMRSLTDGAAVSAQVAVNTAKVSELEETRGYPVFDMVEDGFAITDNKYNIGVLIDTEGIHAKGLVKCEKIND